MPRGCADKAAWCHLTIHLLPCSMRTRLPRTLPSFRCAKCTSCTFNDNELPLRDDTSSCQASTACSSRSVAASECWSLAATAIGDVCTSAHHTVRPRAGIHRTLTHHRRALQCRIACCIVIHSPGALLPDDAAVTVQSILPVHVTVEPSQVVPSRDMSPHQALVAQLEAIRRNDDPWTNHGVQTMYEFAADAGSMERSRYFGFSKDLYHLDHFLVFHTKCASLVDCCAYAVLAGPPPSLQQRQPGGAVASPAQPETNMQTFHVHVTADSRGEDGGVYELVLVRGDTGLRAGCWMTKSCVRVL